MNGNGADWIVDFQSVFKEGAAQANQNTGDQADDASARRVDEAARCGDGHEAREQAIAAHRIVRLAFERPHVEDGTHRSGATRQHGVNSNRADAQIAVGGSA